MWRTTGNEVWRERGWAAFEALEKYTRTDSAYAAIKNTFSEDVPLQDSMPRYVDRIYSSYHVRGQTQALNTNIQRFVVSSSQKRLNTYTSFSPTSHFYPWTNTCSTPRRTRSLYSSGPRQRRKSLGLDRRYSGGGMCFLSFFHG